MTARELLETLRALPEDKLDATVVVFMQDEVRTPRDYMAWVASATWVGQSAISNPEFQIAIGERFAY